MTGCTSCPALPRAWDKRLPRPIKFSTLPSPIQFLEYQMIGALCRFDILGNLVSAHRSQVRTTHGWCNTRTRCVRCTTSAAYARYQAYRAHVWHLLRWWRISHNQIFGPKIWHTKCVRPSCPAQKRLSIVPPITKKLTWTSLSPLHVFMHSRKVYFLFLIKKMRLQGVSKIMTLMMLPWFVQKVSIQNLNCPKNACAAADMIFIPALRSEDWAGIKIMSAHAFLAFLGQLRFWLDTFE